MDSSGKRGRDVGFEESEKEMENSANTNKRQKMKETETERTESPVKDVVPNTIDTILNMEADIPHREEEVGGKTVNIGELEDLINQESPDSSSVENEPMTPPRATPRKSKPLTPCLSEKRTASAKRIHFGKKAIVDFSESEPVTSLTPLLQRVESDLTTHATAVTEVASPDSPETSRNSSYLSQFDAEPDIPSLSRASQRLRLSVLSGAPQPASEDSSLLSSAGGSRRQTADLQELQALLNDEQATSPNGTADAGASVAGAASVEDKTV
ncbi:hypothetical protein WA556_000076, partial [Blastocystis sp. ATCC 50177/Nand II]